MAEDRAAWLAVGHNREEWGRLVRALSLEGGFALLLVDVPDVGTEGRVVELLEERGPLLDLDARSKGEMAPVKQLLRCAGELAVIRSVEASRSDPDVLVRCLVQLNARRDQLVAQAHVLMLIVRRDAAAGLRDVAPDLYSIHRARFRFSRLVEPQRPPLWLLRDVEVSLVLLEESPSPGDRSSLPLLSGMNSWIDDFDSWMKVSIPPPSPVVIATLFSRAQAVPWSVCPRHALVAAIESPRLEVADVLTRAAGGRSGAARLASTALAWMHLQRSEIEEARAHLARIHDTQDALERDALRSWHRRNQMLEHQCDAAEGFISRITEAQLDQGDARVIWSTADVQYAAMDLTASTLMHELRSCTIAPKLVRQALDTLEARERNLWRFEPTLRTLPAELLEAAMPQAERDRALDWLEDRRARLDPEWERTWAKHLMIERGLGDTARQGSLLGWGLERLELLNRSYDVWWPLVDIHAEIEDVDVLARLARQPLGEYGQRWFGKRFAAALCVVADLIHREVIALTEAESSECRARARAAAREHLPPHVRVGWWALELALGPRGSSEVE